MSNKNFMRIFSFLMACLLSLSSVNMPVFASELSGYDVSFEEETTVLEEPQTEEIYEGCEEETTVLEEVSTEEKNITDISSEEETAVLEELTTEENNTTDISVEEETVALEKTQTEEMGVSNEEEISVDISEDAYGENPAMDKPAYTLNYRVISEAKKTACITGYEGTMDIDDFTVPDEINGYKITEIGERAFENCTGLTGVVHFGNFLEIIGERAFLNCSGLIGYSASYSLSGPNKGVSEIRDYAFQNCTGLENIVFSEYISYIGNNVFAGCTNIYYITNYSACTVSLENIAKDGDYWVKYGTGEIVESVAPDSTVYTASFEYRVISAKEKTAAISRFLCFADKINNIIIPSTIDGYTIKEIDNNAFRNYNPNNRSAIKIPDTITKIGDNAFRNRVNDTEPLVIPDSVTYIGNYAFSESDISGTLDIPGSVTYIGDCAFSECQKITELILGYGVETIGFRAFELTGIKELVIPDTVTSIEYEAFCDCTQLEGKLVIPENLNHIEYDCFKNTSINMVENRSSSRFSNIGLDADDQNWTDFTTGTVANRDDKNTIVVEPKQILICGAALLQYDYESLSPTEIRITKYKGEIREDFYIPEKYNGLTITEINEDVFKNVKGITKLVNMSKAQVILPVVEGHCWTLMGTGTRFVTVLPPGETAVLDDYKGTGLHFEGLKIEDYEYTGSGIKPDIKVYEGSKLLKEKTDYTITYKNNIKVYTYKENEEGFVATKAPSITITGKGNYSDKRTLYFTIGKKSIEDSDIVIPDISSAIEGKKDYKPSPKVTYGNKTLKKGTDYTIKYYNRQNNVEVAPREAGKYVAVISGCGSFTGTVEKYFNIHPSTTKYASKLTVILDRKSYEYDGGNPIKPVVTIKDGKTVLDTNEFKIGYKNNTQAGTGTVLIAAKNNSYLGTKEVNFKITGKSISGYPVKGIKTNLVYNGKEQNQGVDCKSSTVILGSTPVKWILKSTYDTLSDDQKLEYGALVTYENSTNVGTASMIFTGVNGYTGTKKATYKIKAYEIKDTVENKFKVSLSKDSYEYNSSGVKPDPIVTFNGKALTEGKDYTVSYANNTKLADATASKKPTVKVKGKGNYSGAINKTFIIERCSIQSMSAEICGKVFSSKPGGWKSEPVIINSEGKKLKLGKDFVVSYTYYYFSSSTPVRDGSKKNYPNITRNAGDIVGEKDIVPYGAYIKVNVEGIGNYKEIKTLYYSISLHDINKLKITIAPQTYTGREITVPYEDITIKDAKGNVYDAQYFKFSAYKNNINKGTASVVCSNSDYYHYDGSKTVTFKIKEKKFLWWR